MLVLKCVEQSKFSGAFVVILSINISKDYNIEYEINRDPKGDTLKIVFPSLSVMTVLVLESLRLFLEENKTDVEAWRRLENILR